MTRETISAEYLNLQQELHKNPGYGVASIQFAPLVAKILSTTSAKTLTDYGAGKLRLKETLDSMGPINFDYLPYDPAYPEYGEPSPADLVCCIDVLEHVEPDRLEAVLEELASITRKFGFFTVHMGPAGKTLSDGRNAHLIQKPTSWWLPRLCKYFNLLELKQHSVFGTGFWCITTPITQIG